MLPIKAAIVQRRRYYFLKLIFPGKTSPGIINNESWLRAIRWFNLTVIFFIYQNEILKPVGGNSAEQIPGIRYVFVIWVMFGVWWNAFLKLRGRTIKQKVYTVRSFCNCQLKLEFIFANKIKYKARNIFQSVGLYIFSILILSSNT